ncbi:hypothetical protein O1M63_48725 [Streptomyces mirabilis]|nr:hypothetical protein [Streptomyces mirabilis]
MIAAACGTRRRTRRAAGRRRGRRTDGSQGRPGLLGEAHDKVVDAPPGRSVAPLVGIGAADLLRRRGRLRLRQRPQRLLKAPAAAW